MHGRSQTAGRRVCLALILCVAAAVLNSCGDEKKAIRTALPVVGLALDGNRLAWTDCQEIHVLQDNADVRVSLPEAVRGTCASEGELVFAGDNIGWLFATSDRESHSVVLGTSSIKPPSSRVLEADRSYDEKANAGFHGAVAADGGMVLWSWPHVSLLGSSVHFCELYNPADSCKVGIRSTGVHASAGQRTVVLRQIPPAGAVAASHGWVAIAVSKPGTYPQRRNAGPRVVLVVRRRDGAVLARVTSREPAQAIALSHRILAVERLARVDLYRLPGGRRLRSIPLRSRTEYRFTGWISVSGGNVVVWRTDEIDVLDATTGERSFVVHTRGLHGLESDQVITAVASDDARLAWATTGHRGGSTIHTRTAAGL